MADTRVVTKPKARKHHNCQECYDGIKPGDVYENVFSVYDSMVWTSKYCIRCCEAINRAFSERVFEVDEGYPVGEFWTSLKDSIGDASEFAKWNPPKEWTHRLEVWLTPEVWMTCWDGKPGRSDDKRYIEELEPHGYMSERNARKILAMLDPDGSIYPDVELRWVKEEDNGTE